MKGLYYGLLLAGISMSVASGAVTAQAAQQVESQAEIQLELPAIETSQYHRPYVAVWIEDANQNPVKLVALWREKPDWLKDLRRFWRKIGRSNTALVDAVSGATEKPGNYSLSWDGKDDNGNVLAVAEYTLLIEAAREQGGRSLVKQNFTLPGNGMKITIDADGELGPISATIN